MEIKRKKERKKATTTTRKTTTEDEIYGFTIEFTIYGTFVICAAVNVAARWFVITSMHKPFLVPEQKNGGEDNSVVRDGRDSDDDKGVSELAWIWF